MRKILSVLLATILLCTTDGLSQTLTETQMRNARATGYAIVAARNPGVSFSIYMIPWDGVNSLEYNANTQINSAWHAQAAIKGNYFYQPFDGEDFSAYSSVVTSQQEFDAYKSMGTQWWIVCSTLPSFSATISSKDGNIGIGSTNPSNRLEVAGSTFNRVSAIVNADVQTGYQWKRTAGTNLTDWEMYVPANSTSLMLYNGGDRVSFLSNGNMGIGTTTPTEKLSVNGNIKAKKLMITQANWPDYVFHPSYKLKSLAEVKSFIKMNQHLPEMPSAEEIKEKGVSVGETQALLLKKIEELTLYVIALKEENRRQQKQIDDFTKKK